MVPRDNIGTSGASVVNFDSLLLPTTIGSVIHSLPFPFLLFLPFESLFNGVFFLLLSTFSGICFQL